MRPLIVFALLALGMWLVFNEYTLVPVLLACTAMLIILQSHAR